MTHTEVNIIKFRPWSSFVELSFWFNLAQKKLNEFKLSTSKVPITAYASVCNPQNAFTQIVLDSVAFEQPPAPKFHCAVKGNLTVLNTIQEFKNFDRVNHLDCIKKEIWRKINDDTDVTASSLNIFELITFVDLKKYLFYYWFIFPAIIPKINFTIAEKKLLSESNLGDGHRIEKLRDMAQVQLENGNLIFQVIFENEDTIRTEQINNWESNGMLVSISLEDQEVYNWALRNVLIYLQVRKHIFQLELIRLRMHGDRLMKDSDISTIVIPKEVPEYEDLSITGWERNRNNQLAPNFLDLKNYMDKSLLASHAIDLNLKLMKWNFFSNLDLSLIQDTSCLLLGAGTLGCNVARNLMAWGFKKITFVDHAKISYSNPIRQSLFTYKDSQKDLFKATVAAIRCKKIFPGSMVQGINLHIPTIGLSLQEGDTLLIRKLESLIEEHDVIFLLFDSRESRWLPSLIATAQGKICFTVALGFDSYLVMRHGIHYHNCEPLPSQEVSIGCYFCNDPDAPHDTMPNRTIDQQCTVVRPGLSPLASALSVEILVSLLHHPLKGRAPVEEGKEMEYILNSHLGIVPHQTRGFLSKFLTINMIGHRSKNCIGCSEAVVRSYVERKYEFLAEVFQTPTKLEDMAGITAIKQETYKVFDLDSVFESE